jgi:iron complex outermembrane receptor protein
VAATTLQSAVGPVQGYVASRSATATKTNTPLIETPQSISVITQDQIRDTGARTLGESLSYSAGIQTQPFGFDGRYDQFMIRGFTSSQFGIYKDGLRQANGTFAYFRNEPYGLERVEVLRGPSSVLYGANEAGGLVNLVSKMPLDTRFNEASLYIGNYDRYQGSFDFSGPVDNQLLYRFTGLARDSSTQVPGTWDDRYSVAPAFTVRLGADTTLTILSEFAKNKNSMWPYYLRIPAVGVTNIRVGDPSFDELKQSQESIGYRLEHRATNDVTFRQNLRFGHVDWEGHFVDAQGLVGNTLTRYAGLFKEQLFGFNLDNQAEVKFATGPVSHTVLTGVDYFWQSANLSQALATAPSLNLLNPVYSTGPVGPNFTTINATYQTLSQVGVYAQDQLAFGGWRLTLGGRQDYADLTSESRLAGPSLGKVTESQPSKFTGRAGLLYLFDFGLAPYVSYATSFLPQAGVSAPGRGAQPFAPTTGESIEGGVKYQPVGWNTTFTASVYNLTKDNVLTADPVYGASYSVQTGQIRSQGVELEAVTSLTSGLRGIASYSYTDAKVTRSNSVDLNKIPIAVPENQAAFFLDYTWQAGIAAGFGLGGGVRYTGETWADNINTIRNPAIVALDAGVHYEYSFMRFAFNVRNLLDDRVGICNAGNCTFSLGRTMLASATAHW